MADKAGKIYTLPSLLKGVSAPGTPLFLNYVGKFSGLESEPIFTASMSETTDWLKVAIETRPVSFEKVTSTVATGTAPFACTSTTVNTNLNADLWDGYQFSDYINQAVKTTSNVTFGSLTNSALHSGRVTYAAVDGLLTDSVNLTYDGTTLTSGALSVNTATFLTSTQPYLVTSRASTSFVLHGQSTGANCILDLFTKDTSGKSSILNLWSKGSPTDISVSERLVLYHLSTGAVIASLASGAGGVVRPLSIYCGTYTTQLVLNIDGSISTAGALTCGGIITSSSGFASGGDVGADGSVAVAKVGGGTRTMHFCSGLYTGYTDS
jgi:hypothetical protein